MHIECNYPVKSNSIIMTDGWWPRGIMIVIIKSNKEIDEILEPYW